MLDLTPEIVSLLMFGGLLLGIAMGLPLAFVLGGTATIVGYLGWGARIFPLFVTRILGTMNDFILVAIPLFILMSQLMNVSGIAEKAFEVIRVLLGNLRGGVAVTVIVVSTILAACTGITGAACVAMGLTALPIMVKYGYDKKLATGCIAGSSSLGILIPPSIMLIVMAEQSGETVGRLFAGAIIPGLILSALFIIYTLYQCYKYPWKGPSIPPEDRAKYTTKDLILETLISLVPPFILIIGVLGSIFMGVATPTEAAAVGAFITLILVVVYGRFTIRRFLDVLFTTVRTSSMVLTIMVGATCFTAVFIGLGGAKMVQDLIFSVPGGRWMQFFIMMLVIFYLGMFVDWVAIVMITFPIFLPIARTLDFNMLWFVVCVAVMKQDSFNTPPFGYNLFYLKGIAPKGVTTRDIYLGAVPYWILMEVGLLICVIFPQTVTWLPRILVR